MFKITRNLNLDVTTVSNCFIRDIMPSADGEYVKVYLYFLSISSRNNTCLDMESIAENLGTTVKKIIDALLYWEEVGVMEGAYNGRGELISVTFLDVPEINESFSKSLANKNKSSDKEAVSKNIRDESISISPEKLKKLKSKTDVKIILTASEQYMGHTLKKNEIDTLLYLYDRCNFNVELIDYLLDYCISRGKNNINYIKEVAFSWYESGIDSAKKAKENAVKYNEEHNKIMKALGIKRSLGEIELGYINKWTKENKLPIDMIVEACNRTIITIGKPDFRYIDSILNKWSESNIKSIEELKKYEKENVSEIKKSQPNISKKRKNIANKFHNHKERTYLPGELQMGYYTGLDLEETDDFEKINLA